MTANQLRQVLRTYSTQWACWGAMLTWLLLHAQLLLLLLLPGAGPWPSVPPSERLLNIMTGPLTANLLLGMMIGWMLKLQFANPRARLLPGFRAAHLVVAAAVVGAAIAMEAVLVPAWEGAGAQLALLSLTFLAIVAATWITYLVSSFGFWLFVILMFANVFARQYVAGLIQALSDRPMVSWGIACVGLAAMAALGVRLWTLCEEKPEYSRQLPGVRDFTSRAGNRKRRRLEALAIARSGPRGWLLDVQFRLVLRGKRAMGPLRRLLFRQLAGGFSSLSVMMGVFGVMLSLLWFQSWSQQAIDPGVVFFLSFFALHMVLSMLGGLWLRRWPYLARESLWPLERRDLVRDLARSMACDMAPAAGAHCAAIIVWLGLVSRQDPLSGLLLPLLGLTMAQYMVAYCLMFWLVSFRRPWVLVLGILVSGVSAALVIAALLFAGKGFWSPLNVALAIIGTALAVALLYRLAFRRWCHVDLD